jgi:hypothetical protein
MMSRDAARIHTVIHTCLHTVIPANAGIQRLRISTSLGSSLRWNDEQ